MKNIMFEFRRMKKIFGPLSLAALVLQLVFLCFFALVGRFDSSGSSSMLNDYSAVLGLATTGTMCVLAIYGTVLADRLFVRDYVGMNKSKTYLLPISRKELFYTKLVAFSAIVAATMIIGLVVSDLIFAAVRLLVPLAADRSDMNHLDLGLSILAGTGLTLAIILLSGFIGIRLNSAVKAIIASILFVVFLSNVSAITLMSHTAASLLAVAVLAILVIVGGLIMGDRIDKSEVL